MTPEDYKHLETFKKLLDDTIGALENAGSQATLAAAAETYAARWKEADDDFAQILTGIRAQAWSMPFPQARAVSRKVVEHLEITRQSVAEKLKRG